MNNPARRAAVLLLTLLSMFQAGHANAANCTPSNITLFTATPVNFGVYSPYSLLPITATFLVTISTNANCTNLYFGMSATGGTFAPTAPSLDYTVLGSPPTLTNPDKINVNQTTVVQTFTARIAAGQLASGGYHTTAAGTPIRLNLYVKEQGDLVQPPARSIVLDASVLVLAGCQLPPPSLANVDFTAALTTGVANPAIVRTVTFTGASCILPARIQLSGAALQPSAPLTTRPGFDNLINWSAAATFGNASTTLNTTGTATIQSTSAAKNSNGLGPTTGNIAVNINLLAGTRPQAGTYSGILTVTIDPLF